MPPQAAPQSVSAPTANSPTLLPIPQYRVHLFEIGVSERLHEGQSKGVSEAEILATIRTERLALAEALQQQNFRDAFAHTYEQAHNAVMPAAAISPEESRRATDEIIAHRVNDANWLAQLVTQPDFIAKARTTTEVKPTPYRLPREKIAEMTARFTADGSSYGIDARVHNQQSMEGHRIGHLVLAQVYADNGPLQAVLEQNLAQQLGDAAVAKRLASDWLEARRKPAIATAETLGVTGEVYQQVMQRSDAPHSVPTTQIVASTVRTTAVGFPLALQSSTTLSPREIERSKDTKERASEWAYTMNHALSCGMTDVFIQPFASKWVSDAVHEKRMPPGLRWLPNIFEKHDHAHGHDDHHGHGHDDHHGHGHDHAPSLRNNLSHWVGGEIAGDVGAVPLTVLTQRFAPGLMSGIRHVIEPIFGSVFHRGAQRDAERWALKHGETDSNAIVNKAQELYEYEMNHLPQAVVWNAYSIPINLASQRYVFHSKLTWGEMLIGKTFGSLVSNLALIGGRAMMPGSFHKWDSFASDKVVVPITKGVGNIFGADTSRVDEIARKEREHEQHGRWSGRVAADSAEVQPAR